MWSAASPSRSRSARGWRCRGRAHSGARRSCGGEDTPAHGELRGAAQAWDTPLRDTACLPHRRRPAASVWSSTVGHRPETDTNVTNRAVEESRLWRLSQRRRAWGGRQKRERDFC
eukprot:3953162-Pleurochrysis_carterae.AAC.2